MVEHPSSSWYVSKRVGSPAAVVVRQFDRAVARGAVVVDDGTELAFGSGERPVGVPRAGPDRRRIDGRLRYPGRLPVRFAVEVQVEPWSHTECEIALRPAGRRFLPDAIRFGRAASSALDGLRAVILDGIGARAGLDTTERLRRAS